MPTNPVFRPQFTVAQTRALHRILNNFNLPGDDLEAGIVIERLKENISKFLLVNNASMRLQIRQELKEEAIDADSFNWEAELEKIDAMVASQKKE